MPSSVREVTLNKKDQDRLDKTERKAGMIIGKKNQDDRDTLFQRRMTNKMLEIIKDPTHSQHKNVIADRTVELGGKYRTLNTVTATQTPSCQNQSLYFVINYRGEDWTKRV